MKKLYSIFMLFCLLLTSFRCTTSTWSFAILLQFQGENQENVEGLNVFFEPDLYYDNQLIQFENRQEHSDSGSSFKGYEAYFFLCSIKDVPSNTRYLDWDKIQDILDNYSIKVVDGKGIYKDYITTLRELIENSEYKNRKLLEYDENGENYSNILTFKIPLAKTEEQ